VINPFLAYVFFGHNLNLPPFRGTLRIFMLLERMGGKLCLY
jgi:hypothetical protein